MANFDELKLMVTQRDIDILCISETWLLPLTPDAHVQIPDYVIYRKDLGRGGGVCIYIKQHLTSKLINTNIPSQSGVEDIWISVQCRKLPSVIVGCIYRHPKAHSDSFEYINEKLKCAILLKKTIFVLGDLNDNLLAHDNKLSHIISSNKLTQIVKKPTRITPTSATLLDVIITNSPEIISDSDVIPHIIGDHDLITLTANITKPKRLPVVKTFRDLKNYSNDILCLHILNELQNLNKIMATDNINEQVDVLTSVFSQSLEKCAPFVTREIKRPPAPWITSEIRDVMATRDLAHKELKTDRLNQLLQERYKHLKKRTKSLISAAKQQYYHNELSNAKGNTSATWNTVKNLIPSKTKQNNCCFDDVVTKAEEFNHFFANIGSNTFASAQASLHANTSGNSQPDAPRPVASVINPFRPQPVDINTVILTVKHLRNTKSYGSDNISLRFIKDSLFVTAFYLTHIINTSIITGVFPSAWKTSIVTPLHKNGDTEVVSNYRPISLLPIFSKIIEKIVSNQLTSFLETNKLLSNTQHGFRPKLSTTTALTSITDKIYHNMDNKQISLLTLCDLSKAFDSVSHPILLQKLSKVNIDRFWFVSYLENRTQCVRLQNTKSSQLNVKFGVPQGSILGPILFNIYVNDLSNYISNCTLVQYADDTQFLHSGKIDSLQEILNKTTATLTGARDYFLKNGLQLNTTKTQCIFIGSRQYISQIPSDVAIHIGDTIVKPSISVKNLGIYMDSHLSFNIHINELCKKVMGVLIYINRIKENFDENTRHIIVQSLALSLINYGNIIWGTACNTHISKVQKMQNFAAKVIDGKARKFDHVTPLLNELQWLTIEKQIVFDTAVTVYKSVRGLFPDHLLSFPSVNSVTQSSTRQRNNLYIPKANTDSGARSLAVRGPKTWNSLPEHVKASNTTATFKKRLCNHLLSHS